MYRATIHVACIAHWHVNTTKTANNVVLRNFSLVVTEVTIMSPNTNQKLVKYKLCSKYTYYVIILEANILKISEQSLVFILF